GDRPSFGTLEVLFRGLCALLQITSPTGVLSVVDRVVSSPRLGLSVVRVPLARSWFVGGLLATEHAFPIRVGLSSVLGLWRKSLARSGSAGRSRLGTSGHGNRAAEVDDHAPIRREREGA